MERSTVTFLGRVVPKKSHVDSKLKVGDELPNAAPWLGSTINIPTISIRCILAQYLFISL